jgi:hypothetical protein
MAIKSNIDASEVGNLNGINFRMWKRYISYVLKHEKTLHTFTIDKPKLVNQKDTKVTKK